MYIKLIFIQEKEITNYYYYYYNYYYIRGLKTVFSRWEDVAKDRNTRDYLVQTIGNGYPMHGACNCASIPHRIPRA